MAAPLLRSVVTGGAVALATCACTWAHTDQQRRATPSGARRVLEACVGDVESAVEAMRGGADRVELCADLGAGGTTPSVGTIAQVVQALQHSRTKVRVLIRPRPGDFVYTTRELEAMKEDVAVCKRLGVDGVVVGVLRSDGTLDHRAIRELVETARPLRVTCHRAFDVCLDKESALEQLVDLGVDAVLTSGGKTSAWAGRDMLEKLQEQAAGRITLIAGAGVSETNVPAARP